MITLILCLLVLNLVWTYLIVTTCTGAVEAQLTLRDNDRIESDSERMLELHQRLDRIEAKLDYPRKLADYEDRLADYCNGATIPEPIKPRRP